MGTPGPDFPCPAPRTPRQCPGATSPCPSDAAAGPISSSPQPCPAMEPSSQLPTAMGKDER